MGSATADGVAGTLPEEYAHSFQFINLGPHVNNVGSTPVTSTRAGAFNVWGNSFPAQELPSARTAVVSGVPFLFPAVGGGEPDNVRCAGQHVRVSPGRYDWVYVIAAAERRAEDELACHYMDGSVDFEPLRISDFWAAPAAFGETLALRTATMHYPLHVQTDVPAMLWCQRVPLVRRADLVAIRLPRNPAVHIFAATLLESPRWSA